MKDRSPSWSQSEGDHEKPVWTSGRNNYAYFSVNFNERRASRSGPYFVTKAYRYHGKWENQLKLPASLTGLESSTTKNSVIEEDTMSQVERKANHASDDSHRDSMTMSQMLDKYGLADSQEISQTSQSSHLSDNDFEDTLWCDKTGVRKYDSLARVKLQSKIREIIKGKQALLVNRCTQASPQKSVDACVGDDDCPVVTYEDKAVQVDLLPPVQTIAEKTSTGIQTESVATKQELDRKSSALNSRRLHRKETILKKSQTISDSVSQKSTHSCKRVKQLETVTGSSDLSEQCVAEEKCYNAAAVGTEQAENQKQEEIDRNHLPSNSRKELKKTVEISSGLSADDESSDYGVDIRLNVTSNSLSTWENCNSKSVGTKKETHIGVSSRVHRKDSSTLDQEKILEEELMEDISDFMEEGWIYQKSSDERKSRHQKDNRPTSPLEDVGYRETNDFPFAVKKRKRFRNEFVETDRIAIVQFLLDEADGFSSVGGNEIWKHMAICKVCPGHTWQSMKEHYRKKIVPALGQFGETRSGFKKYLKIL